MGLYCICIANVNANPLSNSATAFQLIGWLQLVIADIDGPVIKKEKTKKNMEDLQSKTGIFEFHKNFPAQEILTCNAVTMIIKKNNKRGLCPAHTVW